MNLPFFRRRSTIQDHELDPDEIFLDASNLPGFDHARLEGRLEQPLGQGNYLMVGVGVGLLLLILFTKAVGIELLSGEAYAAQSEKNRLRPEMIFAERGAILDRNGATLVLNEPSDNGFPKRVYKTPGFGHVLGYVSYPKKDSSGNFYDTEIKGVAGVEAAFNGSLSGENGTVLTEEDAHGTMQSQGIVVPPKTGQTLTLSIDERAQEAFFTSIRDLADKVPFIGGSGILMNVDTGEIVALVSYPEYDPNVLSSGSPADVIASYAKDSRQVYLDRAVSGLYTPGSIIKPIEASGALTDGIVTPDYTINDIGYITVPNPYDSAHPSIFKDWKAIGVEDLRTAIAFSSDVYFYTLGGGYGTQKGLGIERLRQWYDSFGLESITGIEIAGEKAGFVPTPAWKEKTFNEPWRIGDTYHTAIGQYAMQITPLEAVRAIAAVANGGKLVRPTLQKDAPVGGESIAVSSDALQVVREGMRKGVTEGTSVGLNSLSFLKAAGKTGTAQTGVHNEYYNSWAVGFFPYDHPQYAYAVVMERGPAGNATGGVYVMSQFFSKLHAAAPEYFQ